MRFEGFDQLFKVSPSIIEENCDEIWLPRKPFVYLGIRIIN